MKTEQLYTSSILLPALLEVYSDRGVCSSVHNISLVFSATPTFRWSLYQTEATSTYL